jgi:DnaJ-class molecular chaperone
MKSHTISKEPCLICAGKGRQADLACAFCEGTGVVAVRGQGSADIVERVLGRDVVRVNAKTRKARP